MLRPIAHSDLPQIREWAACPEFEEYFRRFPPVFTWPDDTQLLQWFAHALAIIDNDKLVGLLPIANLDAQNRRAEIGLMVDPALCTSEKLTVATKAGLAGLSYIFDYLGFEKVYCLVLAHRDKLTQRLEAIGGFTHEGRLRKNIFWKGEFHDEIVLGITKEEFKRIK